jgi:hypothetical protein
LLQNVICVPNERRTIANECVGAFTLAGSDGTGNGEDISILLDRKTSGNERPAFSAGFDDDDPEAKPADDPISPGKMSWICRFSDGKLADNDTLLGDRSEEFQVTGWCGPVQAASQNGDRSPVSFERTSVCVTVYPEGQSAYDNDARSYESGGQLAGHLFAIGGVCAGTDDSHRRLVQKIGVAQEKEHGRWCVGMSEEVRVSRVVQAEKPDAAIFASRKLFGRPLAISLGSNRTSGLQADAFDRT